ncbi:MAG TPA: heavy-metal-associated domain-containing protein [Phycisphaerales bacterium]|nr:heavy-metal-associated domain-containing protein [Phycisphaerales bacterium]
MKHHIIGVAVAGMALVAGGCNSAHRSSDVRTAVFKVDGMACENCAKHIEEELVEVPGVKTAKVDFASKTARVTLDESNPASQKALDAAVTKWKMEHFAQEEDPECLDPKRREEIKRGGK